MKGSFPVIINKSNSINGNTFVYSFPSNVDFTNIEIALSDLSMYYSWFSITSAYNNNKFTFTYPGSGSTATYNITLPDGTYSIGDLNNYIQYFCIQNSLYLINNATGDYKYYLTLTENAAQYAVSFNGFPVGTAMPSGYSAPVGHPGFPAVNSIPQLIINNVGFGQIIGFDLGTYPSSANGAANYTKNSTFIPQVSPIQSVLILIDACWNPFSSNSGVVATINSKGVQFGSLISYNSPESNFVRCQQGMRQQITVRFVDQLFRPLQILDDNLTIRLLLRVDEGGP